MLHKSPKLISPETFKLIQQLQALPELKEYYLVGGTSLALQIGHRNSVDIDLFTKNDFDERELLEFLKSIYAVKERYVGNRTIIIFINNIKVDFIRHNYPFVKPPFTEEDIHFISKEDIAAMKLSAISQSGKRLKDFIDLYFLFEYFSLEQMLGFFEMKYPTTNPLIPLRAINYFDDIDPEMDPPKLLKPLPFDKIKTRIRQATLHKSRVF